jgi:hypothetical protein
MRLCEETHSICPWYKAVFSPPPGWEEDTIYGDKNLVTVFAPKNRQVPFIYVRTELVQPGSSLGDDISDYQKKWTTRHHESRFVKRDDIVPSDLQSKFVVYECKNPSLPKQPLEFVAFTRQSMALQKNYDFTFQIILTGSTKKSVENELTTLKALLENF